MSVEMKWSLTRLTASGIGEPIANEVNAAMVASIGERMVSTIVFLISTALDEIVEGQVSVRSSPRV